MILSSFEAKLLKKVGYAYYPPELLYCAIYVKNETFTVRKFFHN